MDESIKILWEERKDLLSENRPEEMGSNLTKSKPYPLNQRKAKKERCWET